MKALSLTVQRVWQMLKFLTDKQTDYRETNTHTDRKTDRTKTTCIGIKIRMSSKPVKNRAMAAMNLWKAWRLSNGMNLCKNVSLNTVMMFLLMVINKQE